MILVWGVSNGKVREKKLKIRNKNKILVFFFHIAFCVRTHKILTFSDIVSQEDNGHQSSGARAPELWCPHLFF